MDTCCSLMVVDLQAVPTVRSVTVSCWPACGLYRLIVRGFLYLLHISLNTRSAVVILEYSSTQYIGAVRVLNRCTRIVQTNCDLLCVTLYIYLYYCKFSVAIFRCHPVM